MGTWSSMEGKNTALTWQIQTPKSPVWCSDLVAKRRMQGTCAWNLPFSLGFSGASPPNEAFGFGVVSQSLGTAPNLGCDDGKCVQLRVGSGRIQTVLTVSASDYCRRRIRAEALQGPSRPPTRFWVSTPTILSSTKSNNLLT